MTSNAVIKSYDPDQWHELKWMSQTQWSTFPKEVRNDSAESTLTETTFHAIKIQLTVNK